MPGPRFEGMKFGSRHEKLQDNEAEPGRLVSSASS